MGFTIIILLIACIIACFFDAKLAVEKEQKYDSVRRNIREFDKASDRGMNASNPAEIYAHLHEMESRYSAIKDNVRPESLSYYRNEIQSIQEYARDTERENWEEKAEKLLDSFYDNYLLVTEGNFTNVDRMYAAKKQCCSLWFRYFSLQESMGMITDPHPHEFLQNYIGENYDPCMDNSETLERKLSASIADRRPEYQKKKKMYESIVEYVQKNGSVQRSYLLRLKFDGSTPEQVKYCYKDLISRNRLVEMKIGNRYFVELSDKESAKRNKDAKTDGNLP